MNYPLPEVGEVVTVSIPGHRLHGAIGTVVAIYHQDNRCWFDVIHVQLGKQRLSFLPYHLTRDVIMRLAALA